MGNIDQVTKKSECKSFGKNNGSGTFKKCADCLIKSDCQEELKLSFLSEKNEKAGNVEAGSVDSVNSVQIEKIEKKEEKVMTTSNSTQAGKAGKIGKAQEIKDTIFSLAKKAAYTRKELGQAVRAAFPEYKNSTLSTYISDSFNVKYAGATGCGKHRMLAYVQVGKKKIITVR